MKNAKRLLSLLLTLAMLLPMAGIAEDAPAEANPVEQITEAPAEQPTPKPTAAPTEAPTAAPTAEPTEAPTPEPTEAPTPEPTEAPTPEPTETPTSEPTETPTEEPTEAPTEEPTEAPVEEPTETPSPEASTEEPTEVPTEEPTGTPEPEESAAPELDEAPTEQLRVAVEQLDASTLRAVVTGARGEVAYRWQSFDVIAYGELAGAAPEDAAFWADIPGANGSELNAYAAMGENYTLYSYRCEVRVDEVGAVSRPLTFAPRDSSNEIDTLQLDGDALQLDESVAPASACDENGHTWGQDPETKEFNGVCEVCGAKCPHESGNLRYVEYEPNGDKQPVYHDNKYHIVYSTAYQVSYCAECWIELGREKLYDDVGGLEYHELDEEDQCLVCGGYCYSPESHGCNHEHLYTFVENRDDPGVQCAPIDEQWHKLTGNLILSAECEDCGETDLSQWTAEEYTEAHSFVSETDSSGFTQRVKCEYCGYTLECQHENRTLYGDETSVFYENEANDPQYHNVHTASKYWRCNDCGFSWTPDSDGTTGGNNVETVTKEAHEFALGENGEYRCIACGALCTHLRTESYISPASDEISFLEYDENYHIICAPQLKITCCADCHKEFSREVVYESSYYLDSHDFYDSETGMESDTCAYCGYERDPEFGYCYHPNTTQILEADPLERLSYTYEYLDDGSHIVRGDLTVVTYCNDCAKTLSTEKVDSFVEWHVFDSGSNDEHREGDKLTCIYCKRASHCTHENKSVDLMGNLWHEFYVPVPGKDYHELHREAYYWRCNDCGYVFTNDDHSVSEVIQEPHVFSTGINYSTSCLRCGVPCPHTRTETYIEPDYENISRKEYDEVYHVCYAPQYRVTHCSDCFEELDRELLYDSSRFLEMHYFWDPDTQEEGNTCPDCGYTRTSEGCTHPVQVKRLDATPEQRLGYTYEYLDDGSHIVRGDLTIETCCEYCWETLGTEHATSFTERHEFEDYGGADAREDDKLTCIYCKQDSHCTHENRSVSMAGDVFSEFYVPSASGKYHELHREANCWQCDDCGYIFTNEDHWVSEVIHEPHVFSTGLTSSNHCLLCGMLDPENAENLEAVNSKHRHNWVQVDKHVEDAYEQLDGYDGYYEHGLTLTSTTEYKCETCCARKTSVVMARSNEKHSIVSGRCINCNQYPAYSSTSSHTKHNWSVLLPSDMLEDAGFVDVLEYTNEGALGHTVYRETYNGLACSGCSAVTVNVGIYSELKAHSFVAKGTARRCTECGYEEALPSKIILSSTAMTLGVDELAKLNIQEVQPANALGTVTFTTSDPKVVSVSESNPTTKSVSISLDELAPVQLRARASGTATITVKTSNGKTASCKVTVKKAPTAGKLTLNPKTLTLLEEQSATIKATYASGFGGGYTWSVESETGAAEITDKGVLTAVSAGTVKVVATAYNGIRGECEVTIEPAPDTVELNASELTLGVKETFTLKPVAKNGETAVTKATFTYASSDATVASVDSKGKITAKKASADPVTITVTSYNDKIATVPVTVKAAPAKNDLTLSATSKTLGVGETFELTATLKEGKASKLTASTSSSGVATVKEIEPGKFQITAGKTTKTATITVKTFNGVSKTCKITVKKAPTEGKLTLNPKALTIAEEQSATIKTSYASGFGGGCTWSVEPETGAAEITDKGVLTAVSAGTVKVVATAYNGIRGECVVTIEPAPETVELNASELVLGVKETFTLKPAAKNGETTVTKATFTYASSDATIASVDSKGKITAKKASAEPVTISVTSYNDKIATIPVTVKAAPAKNDLTLSATSRSLGVGETFELTATLKEGKASKLTASTNSSGVATVKEIEPGKFQITAGKTTKTATITVKTFNGVSKTCKITVKKAPTEGKLTLNPKALTIAEEQSTTIKTSYASGFGGGYTWSVEPETGAAEITDKGVLTAVSAGTVKVVATAYNGIRGECEVTIEPAPETVELNASELTLGVKETFTLKPVAKNGETTVTKATFTYASSDATVASVDSKGKITAKKASADPVTITVTSYNDKIATIPVTVKAAPAKNDLTLSATSKTLGVGETFELTATLKDGKASKLTASTSSSGVATVKEIEPGKFLITAGKTTKTATITVKTFNGVSKTCKITIKKAPTEGKLTLNPKTLTIAEEQSATIKTSYASGFGGGCTWSVEPETGAAEITDKGVLTAKKAGAVKVVATAYNGIRGECEVTIEPAPETVELNASELVLGVKETFTLKPVAKNGETAVTKATFTFASSDATVASVDSKGKITAKKSSEEPVTITVTSYNDKIATVPVTVKAAPAKNDLTLSATSKTLGVGETFELTATLKEGKASKLTASTSSSGVATVKEIEPGKFLITAGKTTKTATITVKTFNGVSKTCKITVKKAPTEGKLTLNPKALTIAEEQSTTIKTSYASGFGGGCTWSIEPETGAAEITDKGVLTAKKAGTVKVVATAYNGIRGECEVTIEPAPETVELNASELTLGVKETFTLKPVAKNGETTVTKATFTYASSDSAVASVDSKGKITAKKSSEEPVTITVTSYNEKIATIPVTVKAAPAKNDLTLSATSKTLGVGETFELMATLKDGKASKLTASTSSSGVATVKEIEPGKFLITAGKTTKTATITVKTFNGVSKTCKITVKKAPTSAKLSASELTLGAGEAAKLSMSFSPSGSYGNVTWISDDPGVAEVDGGQVKSVAEGSATITASVYNLPEMVCQVTVKAAPSAENASLVPAKVKIGVGESAKLSVVSETAAGSVKSYKSAKTAIATVSKGGVVKGVKAGKSTITATLYNDEPLSCEIEVVAPPTGLTFNNIPEGNALSIGDTWTPEFTISGYGGDDYTGLVTTYTSSNTKVAKFANGTLTAIAKGTTKITCKTYNGKVSKTITLTVK